MQTGVIRKVLPYVSKAFLLLSGLLGVYLTAKYFGPRDRGVIAASLAIVSFVSTFGSLSVGRTILFDIEKTKDGVLDYFKNNLVSILYLVTVLVLLSLFFSYLIFIFYPKVTAGIPFLILTGAFLLLPYLMWASYSSFIFSALNKLDVQSSFTIVLESIYIVGLVTGILYFKLGIKGFVFLTAFFRLVAVIMEVVFLVVHIKPHYAISMKKAYTLTRSGLALHLDSISGYFIASVNVLLVNSFLSKEVVGQFDLSMRLTTVLLIIPTVSQVYISGHISRDGLRSAWGTVHQSIARSVFAVVGLSLIMTLMIDRVIIMLFGSMYISAANGFKFLLPYIICNSICMMFSPFAIARGYFKLMSLLTLVLGSVNILLGYLFIPLYGMMGMIYTTNVVYMVAVIINVFVYFRIKNETFMELK